MVGDERTLEVDGVRYTVRVIGPAPWNRPSSVWKFWKNGPDPDDMMTAELVEVTGHPEPLRSRPRSAIRLGTLHTIPDERLAHLVRKAVDFAHRPPGSDMVALTRGDQRLVIDWGAWNSLCALLLACGHEMEWALGESRVTGRDAEAIRRLLESLALDRKRGERWIASDLRDELREFTSGGTFSLVDIG